MISVPKVSSCVDCATPIIGDQSRCPACHDQHAADILADDETAPRDRTDLASTWQSVIAWLVVALIVGTTVLGLALAGRGCR